MRGLLGCFACFGPEPPLPGGLLAAASLAASEVDSVLEQVEVLIESFSSGKQADASVAKRKATFPAQVADAGEALAQGACG